MNIVLDTNILVSAMWSPDGNAAKVVEAILTNRFTICYDRQIAEEYNKVLRYPKLKFKEDDITAFLEPVLDYGLGIINYPKTDAAFDRNDTNHSSLAPSLFKPELFRHELIPQGKYVLSG